MQSLKSNTFALALVWLAFFAFIAHTFDFGSLHHSCFCHCDDVATSELSWTECDFIPSSAEIRHFCRYDCELCLDSFELTEVVVLIFILLALGKVDFSNVRPFSSFSCSSDVLSRRRVFLLLESLLI